MPLDIRADRDVHQGILGEKDAGRAGPDASDRGETVITIPKHFWDFLHPGWMLQWATENAAAKHSGFNVCVKTQDGVPLCGIVVPEAKGSVTLIADDGKLNEYFSQIGASKL